MRRYAITIFLSAFLLFEVQLLLAKHILPWFGGSASVWTTSMLFFQMLLLAGYGYAHGLVARLGPYAQRRLHLTLLAVSLLSLMVLWWWWGSPLLADGSWKPMDSQSPVTHILALLAVSIGLPFLVLSATNPLAQSWFSRTHPGVSPYRLYALSNAGSLAGLLAYPFVIEPLVTLKAQALLWAAGYLGFAVGLFLCARGVLSLTGRSSNGTGRLATKRPTLTRLPWSQQLTWLLLAACASLLLLATTNQMTQEIAVVPMLWVLPLTLYLLSFILCFESERWYARGPYAVALVIVLFVSGLVLRFGLNVPILMQIASHSATLFVACMVCHGELARLKPVPGHLTAYYFIITLGGAVGGLFVALAAPWLFKGYWELQVGLIACVMLFAVLLWRDPDSFLNRRRWWPLGIPLLAAALLALVVIDAAVELIWVPMPENDTLLRWLAALLFLTPVLMLPAPVRLAIATRLPHWSTRWMQGGGSGGPAGQPDGAGGKWPPRRVRFGSSAAVMLITVGIYSLAMGATALEDTDDATRSLRNFYGVLHLVEEQTDDVQKHRIVLRHGRVNHGFQLQQGPWRDRLVSYYGAQTGIGLALRYHGQRLRHQPIRVGVIGLGSGTLAAGGREGDTFRFYEINPEVILLSQGRDPVFTYLRNSRAKVEIASGDARLLLEREIAAGIPQRFDILAVDAFSSDAIPAHLLTTEAIALYLRHLRDGNSILAIHISNRFLDLQPVVRELARQHRLHVAVVENKPGLHVYESTWVLLSRRPEPLRHPAIRNASLELTPLPPTALWRDDYSSLLKALKW